jgi:hypothetical protein
MQIGDLFEKWGLTSLKVKTPVLEMNWEPADADKDAAWDLYVELLTRISTQRLPFQATTELKAPHWKAFIHCSLLHVPP